MKITTALATASFAFCAALPIAAAPAWPAAPAPAEERRTTMFRFDPAAQRNVLVEFNAPSVLEARGSQQARAATAAIDDLSVRLARDIDRIEGRERASIRSLGQTAPVIRRQYRMTLAGASVRVSSAAVPKIRALSYVRAVHEDREVEAYLQQSVPRIRVPEVRAKYGRRGKGIVVAIIDTGINYNHYALGKGFGPGFKVAGGYDFANDDSDPMDDVGHGTHVAGIVAGDAAPVIGVAPEATLLGYKVLGASGRGNVSDVIAAVERAVDPNGDGDPSDHADVVNMSLGGPRVQDDPLVHAVENTSAAGVIFCVAAGNDIFPASIGSPGAAPSAITVGATDADDFAAVFTSRGPIGGTWGVKPEVAAPGVGITSAFENGTLTASGTSMATPHVAGVVALLLEEHPSWTVDDMKAVLVSTARPVVVKDTGAADVLSAGGGRIDALAAFEASIFPSPATITFGVVPIRGKPHAGTARVTLANRGSSPETFTAAATVPSAGAKLTMKPESVTVAAGASVEVTFTLDLPDTTTPEFTEAPIATSGQIELTGSRSQLHLPWLIVTGDVVAATVGGSDDFAMVISRGPNPAATWPQGPRTYGAFVEATLTADVAVLTQSAPDAPLTVIIRERLPVEGYTPITIQPEEATLQLELSGVDERGVPLGAGDGVDFHAAWHDFTLPSILSLRLTYAGTARSIHINPLKETGIRTYETLFAGSSRYFGAYPVFKRGVKASQKLAIAPGDWASQRIHHHCLTACTASVGAGVYSTHEWDFFLLPPGEGTWDLHVTPPSAAILDTSDFRAHVLVREEGLKVNKYMPWTFLSAPFRNTSGRLAASIFARAGAGDYFAADEQNPISLGEGPIVLRVTMGLRELAVEPYGPLGELMGENAFHIDLKRTKLDGGTAVLLPTDGPSYFGLGGVVGKYELVATDDYTVAGRPGRVTLTARHDNRVQVSVPAVSSFLVTDSRGEVTWTVPAQSAPRLLFAGRLSAYEKYAVNVLSEGVNPSATYVWWRRHGTTEWLPLPLSMTGEDNTWSTREASSPGTLFEAPLAAAAQAEGEIDLKIALGDAYGGTNETVYEPAFVVGPRTLRRRAVH